MKVTTGTSNESLKLRLYLMHELRNYYVMCLIKYVLYLFIQKKTKKTKTIEDRKYYSKK